MFLAERKKKNIFDMFIVFTSRKFLTIQKKKNKSNSNHNQQQTEKGIAVPIYM